MPIGRLFKFRAWFRNAESKLGDEHASKKALIMVLRVVMAIIVLPVGAVAESEAQETDKCPKAGEAGTPYEKVEDARNRVVCLERKIYESIITISTGARVMTQNAPEQVLQSKAIAELVSEPGNIAVLKAKLERAKEDLQEETAVLDFVKNNFGIGFAAGFGRNTRIDTASVDSAGIVRVDEEVTDSPRIVLEAHTFLASFRSGTIGVGPFATVNFGIDGEETLSSVGLGVMVGFRGALKVTKSLNIGIAYALDRGVKRLRDDFVEGSPAPLDAEGTPIEPAFETSSDRALLVVISLTL